jgi:hypothetical protein
MRTYEGASQCNVAEGPEIVVNAEAEAVNNAFRKVRPFIMVRILNEEFPAFLDTGSSISIIGDDVIAKVKEVGVKCRKLEKEIRFLKGTCKAERMVTLKVDYEKGTKKQCFLLVPGALKTILLGRDFLGPSNISVHIGLGGWSIGLEENDVIPFIPPPECFAIVDAELLHPDDPNSTNSEDEQVPSCSSSNLEMTNVLTRDLPNPKTSNESDILSSSI